MFECIVLQLAIAINVRTMEEYIIYRCEGEKKFQYLDREKPFKGVYDINSEKFIILDERRGV